MSNAAVPVPATPANPAASATAVPQPASARPAAAPLWWDAVASAMLKNWLGLAVPGWPTALAPVNRDGAQLASRPEIDTPSNADRLYHATMSKLTLGMSPASLGLAYADWAFHLIQSPGKWQRLLDKAVRKSIRFSNYAAQSAVQPGTAPCIEPLPQDYRFRGDAWQHWPFNLVYQSFLLSQQWWHNATTGIGGVSRHHEEVVAFVARQLLDMMSPVNFMATNPELLDATAREGGQNLIRGSLNYFSDLASAGTSRPAAGTEAFQPGVQVAVTKGQVIFRNRLIELIQYAPTTPTVHADPVLIVPAWIMKYYILDLSPGNSLVNYLVSQGHTVFMISWHNPSAADHDLGMDDYLRLGVLEAVKAVRAIVPERQLHAVGYCLGGTLLSIAAAYLARESEDVLGSVTLLAAQTDFTEAGELMLFIDDSQLSYLEDMMWDQGYLDARQMAGAFAMLRSNDLIWSRMVQEYLLGKRPPMTDLMAWNADATRMPARMHSEYLRRLFLNNDLFEGHFMVEGRPIVLSDIRAPIFAVSTETDHVAPWRSVYKINLLSDSDVTFLLASGGHNAGIVSEPGHKGRHYRVAHRNVGAHYIDPEHWVEVTPPESGSWWLAWERWLAERSGPQVAAPAEPGAAAAGYPPVCAAPGHYVFER